MSTRCNIGIPTTDGKLLMNYCHYDGYPEHVGKHLVLNHNSFDCAAKLVDGPQIRCFEDNGSVDRFLDGNAELHEDLLDASRGVDYVYVYDKGAWKCFKHDHAPYSKNVMIEVSLKG